MITSLGMKILTIRVPTEIAEQIAAKARAEERSQNTVMVRALRDAVADASPAERGDKS